MSNGVDFKRIALENLSKLNAALAREADLQHEVRCLKAVLNGMEFKQVDSIVSGGIDACLFLGQEAARITKGILAERDALKSARNMEFEDETSIEKAVRLFGPFGDGA